MILEIKKLNPNAIIPKYATEGDSGLDLFTLEDTIILAGKTTALKTGIAIGLPPLQEAQIRPRSGISLNGCKGCFKLRSINNQFDTRIQSQPYLRVQLGTIDNQFRGELGIITYNQENYDVFIPAGTKLAQLVVMPVTYVSITEAEELSTTKRGENGFGSTGTTN